MLILYCVLSLVVAISICLLAGRNRPWIAQVAFAALLTGSLVTASKIVPIADGVYVSVAIGLYSMTFLLTDFLGEVHGRRAAIRAVQMAVVAAFLMLFAIVVSIEVSPAPFWQHQEAFEAVLGSAPRILAASILAFVSAQLVDIWIFDKLFRIYSGKRLWLRNNTSTFVGQTIDSVVFYFVAFYGVIPELWGLIITTCLIKYAIALIDTPALYLVTSIVSRKGRSD